MRVGSNTRANYTASLLEFGLVVVLSLVPFLWRVVAGTGDIPTGDAWAYERIFDTFHRTGDIRLVGWNDITLVGVIPVTSLWVALVGYGHHQMHLLGSVMGAIALLGLRSLLATFGVARRVPALLVLGGFSGFVGVAGTYLSDTFAISGAVWALALACRVAYPRGNVLPRWAAVVAVIGAALSAAFGFLVRPQAIVGAVAAGWVLLGWRRGQPLSRERVTRFATFAAAFVAVALPIYLWRSGLENGGELEFSLHLRGLVASLEAMFIAQGLLLFVVMLWLQSMHPISRRGVAIVVGVSLALFAGIAASWSEVQPLHPLVLSIQEQYGLDGGAVFLIALLIAATTGWAWTLRACIAWRDRKLHIGEDSVLRHPLAAVAIFAIGVEMVVVTVLGAYWTRYSLFMACAAVVALMARPLQRSAVAAVATGAVLLTSYWELDHSIAPIEAVKEAADITSCLGIAPDHLDATFSWNGKHYMGIASVGGAEPPSDGLPVTPDWRTFPDMERAAVLTSTNPGTRETWLVVGPIISSALIPTTEQEWWLTVRKSAITTSDQAACLDG